MEIGGHSWITLVLLSGVIYTVSAGFLSIIISIIAKSRGNKGKPQSFAPFIIVGLILGLFSSCLFILVFLTHKGFIGLLDLEMINPLVAVTLYMYGGNLKIVAPLVSLIVAVGFLAVRIVSSIIIDTNLLKYGVITGSIGGAVLIVLGLVYGFVWETTGNSIIAIPIAIIAFLSYSLSSYVHWSTSRLPDLEPRVLEYLKSNNYRISLTEAVNELGYDKHTLTKVISDLEKKGHLKLEDSQ